MRRSLIPPALAVALAPILPSFSAQTSDPIEYHARARLVRMPVLLDERAAGGCDGVALAEIELLEDGVPVETTRLEQHSPPAIHAILVDSGFEMLDVLAELRRFATVYVDLLPPEEMAMLATFDDDLVLRAPLAVERGPLRDAVARLEPGWGSTMWNSLRRMLGYLASRPERKVLVVLTDGADMGQPESLDPATVVELASEVESLLVFPIWLNRPEIRRADRDDPSLALKELAERTGGDFHEVRSPDLLPAAARAIRDRIARERAVIYKPLRFGEGPKDPAGQRDFRWRRRSIRFRTERACKISIAGPVRRYESPVRRHPDSDAHLAGEVVLRPFSLADGGDRLTGRVRDLVRDTGFLQAWRAANPDELFMRKLARGERVTAPRDVIVPLPPLARTTREITSPEAALAFALEAVGRETDAPLTPLLVHGETLLDARGSIAAALARRTDYLAWARDRVRDARLDELDALIEATDPGAEREQLRRAREWLAQLDWEPEPLELQTYLAGWLGDVTVNELSNRLERLLAARLLDGAADGAPADLAAAARAAEDGWTRIMRGFPPPIDVRVFGLLVPAYAPDLDVIGFHRVLLGEPVSAEIGGMVSDTARHRRVTSSAGVGDASTYSRMRAMNRSEDEPLGIRLTAWLLRQPAITSRLTRFRLVDVRYAHPGVRDLNGTLHEMGLDRVLGVHDTFLARQVTLVLTAPGDPGERIPLSAYFARMHAETWRFADEPVCLLLPRRPPRDEAAAALLRTAALTQLDGETPCLLEERIAPD